MALDATVGGAQSNSYVTMAQATAYLSERLHVDAWYPTTTASTEGHTALAHRREAALIWATQLLDQHMTWQGSPATETQALAWPQAGQCDRYGRPIPLDTIPPDIARATAYYALALLGESSSAAQTGGTIGQIKRKKIGALDIEYHAPADVVTTVTPSQGIPADIQALLEPYGAVPDASVKYVDVAVF